MNKPGDMGEEAAKVWFRHHGWDMVRTQPEIAILGRITPQSVGALRKFKGLHRLTCYGHMVVARILGRSGIPDFIGHKDGHYRAVEVKEATGDTCPCSRLDKEQRRFMDALPAGCAFVFVFLTDRRKGQMFEYKPKGSYKYREG